MCIYIYIYINMCIDNTKIYIYIYIYDRNKIPHFSNKNPKKYVPNFVCPWIQLCLIFSALLDLAFQQKGVARVPSQSDVPSVGGGWFPPQRRASRAEPGLGSQLQRVQHGVLFVAKMSCLKSLWVYLGILFKYVINLGEL